MKFVIVSQFPALSFAWDIHSVMMFLRIAGRLYFIYLILTKFKVTLFTEIYLYEYRNQ